jgi:hypothetical protein
MAPRRSLLGRGLAQSKVAPAPAEDRETLDIPDGLDRLRTLLGKTGWAYDEGSALGAFEDAKTVTVVSVNGTPKRFLLEDGREIASGEDLETIAEAVGGRRLRLNVKRRRTQRNRRSRKHRQLRKLTTRRR